ncbi:MAG: GNAT family N-acetyltransferase [Microbacterium sp.]|nr:GNAT family N-acetyltransferase [Microbacterium sp.]
MPSEILTARLRLTRPAPADLDEVFAIHHDPRVWLHYPSLRHLDTAATQAMMASWDRSWTDAGLGSFVARLRDTGEMVGAGGCGVRGVGSDGAVWNVGYRVAADHHGRGYATEIATAGMERARELAPDRPLVAYLVEHNTASAHVAEKLGLDLVHRVPDVGNPDPSVMRLVYADRELTAAQQEVALG